MAPIRVIVVDDSVVVRKIVCDVLGKEPDIEVVASAANGRLALPKIEKLSPDLVTLDVEMPEMNGLETLVEIRKRNPKLPVVMLSSQTHNGAAATLEALSLGANDYVAKPAARSVEDACDKLREMLVPRIRQFFPAHCKGRAPLAEPIGGALPYVASPTPSMLPASDGGARRSLRPAIVAIGSSTGGPNALEAVLSALPGNFGIPIVITQHMPPVFTKMLAQRLSARSKLLVDEAYDGARVESGRAWVAPGDQHMRLRRKGLEVVVELNRQPPVNSCRPAVDPLFESVAAIYGASALAVILTGMGQDGCAGAGEIRKVGGYVIAQDEATSVVWGMPGAVTQAGYANTVVPLVDVAALLAHKEMAGRDVRSASPLPAW